MGTSQRLISPWPINKDKGPRDPFELDAFASLATLRMNRSCGPIRSKAEPSCASWWPIWPRPGPASAATMPIRKVPNTILAQRPDGRLGSHHPDGSVPRGKPAGHGHDPRRRLGLVPVGARHHLRRYETGPSPVPWPSSPTGWGSSSGSSGRWRQRATARCQGR